jgi:hypothetical protein
VVPTLSLRISDFTLADTGNVAVLTPECPMAFRTDDCSAAVNFYGFTPEPFPATARTTISSNGVVLARLLPVVNGGVSAEESADEQLH